MPNVLFAAGEQFNVIERATIVAFSIGGGTEDALYPLSKAYDGRPSSPARFIPGASGLVQFEIDTNQVLNGDFEFFSSGSTEPPDDWTENVLAGTGAVSQTTVGAEVHAGASAAKLVGGTNGVVMYQDIIARAGEKRRIECWLLGDGTAGGLLVRVINLSTGRYLDSSAAWSATAANVFSQTGATYTNHTKNYTVESFTKCASDLVTLRIEVRAIAGVTVFADDVRDWPAVDQLSVIGLRCEDRCVITWSTSTDGSGFSDSVEIGSASNGFSSDQRPNAYYKRASTVQDKAWHRIRFSSGGDTPNVNPEVGELILHQVTTLDRRWDWGFEVKTLDDQITNLTTGGSQQSYVFHRWPRRAVAVEAQYVTDAQMRQSRDDLWGRSRGGAHPVLLVPSDQENLVLLAHMSDAWAVRRRFTANWTENAMLFSELPFVSSAR